MAIFNAMRNLDQKKYELVFVVDLLTFSL